MSNSSTLKYIQFTVYPSNSSVKCPSISKKPTVNCIITPRCKTKVLKTTLKTKNIKIIILPKIQCIYIKQININTVYNYLKNSSKSRKFIDSKNYGCFVGAVSPNVYQMEKPQNMRLTSFST